MLKCNCSEVSKLSISCADLPYNVFISSVRKTPCCCVGGTVVASSAISFTEKKTVCFSNSYIRKYIHFAALRHHYKNEMAHSGSSPNYMKVFAWLVLAKHNKSK